MSASPCPRLFEADAMRDGRLSGAERASFERHLTTCSTCSREVDSLERLAGALRASNASVADELRVRRERTRLLAAFDRHLVLPERRVAPRRLLWPAVVTALVVGAVAVWQARTGVRASRGPGVAVHARGAAVWSERMEGDFERFVLDRGALWIHVDHASGDRRLVVLLPDGELQDTGTTFTVAVADGHTTSVRVEDGHVVLRLRDRPAVLLGPGDAWTAEVPAPAACASAAIAEAPIPSAHAPRPTVPVDSPPASDPSADFRAAMDALDRGDDHEAATRFAGFHGRHPLDARAEDAAYLRVIALQRSGDDGGMKAAAAEYLRLYPAGFRRAEVEALVR